MSIWVTSPEPVELRQNTEAGLKNVSFNRTLVIAGGNASHNPGKKALLTSDLGGNRNTKIKSPKSSISATTGRTSNYRISVTGANTGGSRTPRSNIIYEVGYNQLQEKIRSIQKFGGKIVSIESA